MKLSTKTNRTVVRNAAYRSGEFNIRERHNERKNECYHNGDIVKDRADMNIHFKRNLYPDGTPKTYEQRFNELLAEGKIVKRGLKPDAKVFDELIFDVNTVYFEENGALVAAQNPRRCSGKQPSYEYAKEFFAEAYRCAVNEIGNEDYILSAVLHADERNKALSEELGRDVFHYHLHVVYVPVVQKEILWSKRTKDKSLVGKVREVIPQISHSKKWPMRVPVKREGKMIMLNAYSLLQDRFFEHMKSAGFEGFERGERGSTREHLSDLEYKTMKESERLAAKKEQLVIANDKLHAANEQIAERENELVDKENVIAGMDSELANKENEIIEKETEIADKENQLAAVENEIKSAKKELTITQGKLLTRKQIENIPVKISRPTFGGEDTATITKNDWESVKKTALTQAKNDEDYRAAISEAAALKNEKSKWRKEKQGLENSVEDLRSKVNGAEDYIKRDRLARAAKDAELHNLKNDVAKIPKEVWDSYIKARSQQTIRHSK